MSSTSSDNNKIEHVRHSLAHLLAAAVLKKFPKAKLGIGPTIENGFYYDFDVPRNFTPDDLQEFETEMRRLIKASLPFDAEKLTPQKAKNLFKSQKFKLDLIKDFAKEKKTLTAYHTYSNKDISIASPVTCHMSHVTCFIDLCRGGHVENTNEINLDAFKLTHIAGAYWKGDEKNPQLQRIYGVAFETKEELDIYLQMMEEARKRDHKKLGPELDLFLFSDLVGSGLPLWTPKGTLMRNILDDFVWSLRKSRGYVQVDIPHITKKDLYERSGHWEKFKDELLKIQTREGHIFAMKPMNCPHHTQIYARRPWSYRELPQRYANTTKVYRDEQSGELSGLSRVRAITQDDAHVFCRHSQVKDEIFKVWDIITEFYETFGFELSVRLSLHDPETPEKYLGTPKLWKDAENELRTLVKERGVIAAEAVGEAALYGPKIDFMGKDAIGRLHQVATIQLDMNLPERFDLTCVNEKGERERIVMIHCAIMGSIERFLSVIIEHFAGAFPLWLSPVQVRVLAISDKQKDYAEKVLGELKKSDLRAELTESNETLGKRIREAQLQKIPYVLVVGDKEKAAGTVSVRHYKSGDGGVTTITELIEKMRKENTEKAI